MRPRWEADADARWTGISREACNRGEANLRGQNPFESRRRMLLNLVIGRRDVLARAVCSMASSGRNQRAGSKQEQHYLFNHNFWCFQVWFPFRAGWLRFDDAKRLPRALIFAMGSMPVRSHNCPSGKLRSKHFLASVRLKQLQ